MKFSRLSQTLWSGFVKKHRFRGELERVCVELDAVSAQLRRVCMDISASSHESTIDARRRLPSPPNLTVFARRCVRFPGDGVRLHEDIPYFLEDGLHFSTDANEVCRKSNQAPMFPVKCCADVTRLHRDVV